MSKHDQLLTIIHQTDGIETPSLPALSLFLAPNAALITHTMTSQKSSFEPMEI